MKPKYLLSMTVILLAAILSTPILALAGNGPKHLKHVASLMLGEDRFGQVIFNENPEDDGLYELEVEVEECLELAGSTVDVYLGLDLIGSIEIDESGNGKETFYVLSITTSDTITVDGAVDLVSGAWRLWVKGPGPK